MSHAPRTRPAASTPTRGASSGSGLRSALGLAALLLAACVPAITLEDEGDPESLAREETRSVELRFLRLDAKNFKQVLTKKDLLDKSRFPERILRETWLLDMDLGPLIGNALTTLVGTPAEEAYTLPASSLNMWKLLNMTPANTLLTGTSLAPLLGVGKAVGLSPTLILSDLIGVPQNQQIISVGLTTGAVIEHVVTTHPNAQWRRGPVNAAHPNGRYPVTKGSMPVSLYDVLTDFAELPKSFGPTQADPSNPAAAPHPGFIKGASPIVAATDDFAMTVRVNLNALPYKGLDLTTASVASVNSTSSQITGVFDFSTDAWLEIKGLVPELVIDEMTMAIYENDFFIPGGTSKDPAPLGDSKVWELPGWQFERLIAEVAVIRAQELTAHCTVYSPEGDVQMPLEAVQVCMEDSTWTSITVDDSVKLETPPPPPSYFWDILLEVAQTRLHDGGLAEGEGDIAFTLRDIPAGITTAALEKQIRDNIQQNPAALAAIAELLNENTEGDADFFYYVANPSNSEEVRGDYLYFIAPDDIKNNTSGDPLRPYSYAHPGFYKDRGLTEKVSTTLTLDGDAEHEKVKVHVNDVLYIEDDAGSVFQIDVKSKPGRHTLALDVTRIE